jgi:hypothetical protein
VLSSHIIADAVKDARRAYTYTVRETDGDGSGRHESIAVNSLASFDTDESSLNSQSDDSSCNSNGSGNDHGISRNNTSSSSGPRHNKDTSGSVAQKTTPSVTSARSTRTSKSPIHHSGTRTSATGTNNDAASLSQSQSASAMSADYESSCAIRSTQRRMQRVEARHPTMRMDRHTAEIMQWKHVANTLKASLPTGSPCKQSLPFDAPNIAFQSKLFRSLPGIHSVVNGPMGVTSDLVSDSQSVDSLFNANSLSSAQGSGSGSYGSKRSPKMRKTRGPLNSGIQLTGKTFSLTKPLDTMDEEELAKHTFESINASLSQSGYTVELAQESQLHSLLLGSQRALDTEGNFEDTGLSDDMKTMLSHLGPKKAGFSATLSPMANTIVTKNLQTLGADVRVSNRPGNVTVSSDDTAAVIDVLGDKCDVMEDVTFADIRPSNDMYPGRQTSPRNARTNAMETLEIPRDKMDSSVLAQMFSPSRHAVPVGQGGAILTRSPRTSPSGKSKSKLFGHDSSSSSLKTTSSDPPKPGQLKSFTSFKGPVSAQKIISSEIRELVALSPAQKAKVQKERDRGEKAMRTQSFAVRSELPEQVDKVGPPKELLYNPARLPFLKYDLV